MNDDAELLRQYSEGSSESAFRALVQRHLNLVYFAALRRSNGDTHLAEDITQQVFATLAREAGRLGCSVVLAGWLYVTTRHVAATAMRTESRRRQRESEAFAMQELSCTENVPDWDELRPHIDAAVDALGERDRQAVLLRFFEGCAFAEIGAVLRISEDAARMRVERALEKLKTQLGRRGIQSTAVALSVAMTGQSAQAAPDGLAVVVTAQAMAVPAAGAALTTAGIFKIMSTTKVIVGGCLVVAILSLGTAVLQTGKLHELEERLAEAGRKNADLREHLQKETGAANALVQAEEKKPAAVEKSVADVRTVRVMSEPQDPAFQEMRARMSRLSNRFKYGQLYHKLGLDARRIAAFEDALDEQQRTSLDTLTLAQAQGLKSDDPRLREMLEPVLKSNEDKIRDVLGEEGYGQYRQFKENGMAQMTTDMLATQLYYTDTPLTPEQADRLSKVVMASVQKEAVETGGRSVSGADWAKIIKEMGGTLSEGQISALRSFAEMQTIRAQMSELLGRKAGSASAGKRTGG